MKHPNAEFIKAWADDSQSVQFRCRTGEWISPASLQSFDNPKWEFRRTPKRKYWYAVIRYDPVEGDYHPISRLRDEQCNLRLTCVDGKLTAAEVITEGDGK